MPVSDDLIATLECLIPEFKSLLQGCADDAAVELIRIDFLGRKGRLAKITGRLPELPSTERPILGQTVNLVKKTLNSLFIAKKAALDAVQTAQSLKYFDPTLPGRTPWQGSLHPITLVIEKICNIFAQFGYNIVAGPEVETDFFNFEALNIPTEHPARDMQDTLYIADSIVLRTHTSSLQVRTMLVRTPPIAVVAPGRVYRRDSDITHTPMFHQIEGFLVDTDVSMADLHGTLITFAHKLFGENVNLRFRPSFFPFTEPSVEVDISCVICNGVGSHQGIPCRTCKQTGWLEVLGSGMIDPEVFKAVGYDPERYTGFAFGLGVERIAMLKYGIDDLRIFFENDIRFLHQF